MLSSGAGGDSFSLLRRSPVPQQLRWHPPFPTAQHSPLLGWLHSPARIADEKSAAVLTTLPKQTQVRVIQCLANMDETDQESVRVVESQLQTWMDQVASKQTQRSAGLHAVESILSAAPPDAYHNILNNLELHDRRLAQRIEARQPVGASTDAPTTSPSAVESIHHATFDELAQLDRAMMDRLLASCEPELVVLALAGAKPAVFEQFLARMSVADAARIRQSIDDLGPVRLSDVETAQRELQQSAMQLQHGKSHTDRKRPLAVAA